MASGRAGAVEAEDGAQRADAGGVAAGGEEEALGRRAGAGEAAPAAAATAAAAVGEGRGGYWVSDRRGFRKRSMGIKLNKRYKYGNITESLKRERILCPG